MDRQNGIAAAAFDASHRFAMNLYMLFRRFACIDRLSFPR
jgi:hypothetical protein